MPVDIRVQFNVATAVAVVAAEIISFLWFTGGGWGERFWITSIISDVGLACLLQLICRRYWAIRRYDDAAWLALWLSVLYFVLQAPHTVYSPHTLTRFFWDAVHKFVLMFVMTLCLYQFKNY